MDLNLALVSGRLASPPDLEWLSDGSQRARILVCVRPETRTRFDVIPVLVPPELITDALRRAQGGSRIRVAGPLMRRCSPDPWEPSGRIEIIAAAVALPDCEQAGTTH